MLEEDWKKNGDQKGKKQKEKINKELSLDLEKHPR